MRVLEEQRLAVSDRRRACGSGIEATGSALTVLTGAAMIPHAEKANKVGEDAYFISDCGTYFGAFPRRVSRPSTCGSRALQRNTPDDRLGWISMLCGKRMSWH